MSYFPRNLVNWLVLPPFVLFNFDIDSCLVQKSTLGLGWFSVCLCGVAVIALLYFAINLKLVTTTVNFIFSKSLTYFLVQLIPVFVMFLTITRLHFKSLSSTSLTLFWPHSWHSSNNMTYIKHFNLRLTSAFWPLFSRFLPNSNRFQIT